MKSASLIVLGLSFALVAEAQPLNLGTSSKRIKSKSLAIEAEYSESMRNRQNRKGLDLDNMPHLGALTIEESSSQTAEPIEVNTEVTHSEPMVTAPGRNSNELHSIPGQMNNYWSESVGQTYSSNLEMRNEKKVGVGISAGGQLGVAAFNMEFNFEDRDGVIAGFGAGPGYHTVGLGWKHSFEGRYLSPFITVSYSRWYNSRGLTSEFKHSSVLDQVLTDNEKKEGRFATDFANVSVGLQYNQLRGDLAGLALFAELTAMYEVNRDMVIPNGGVGAVYFF